MIPKPKREKDEAYLKYIKGLPCACRDHTCTGDVVPHHTTTKGAGGSDYLTIPLCYTHHSRIHNEGRIHFQFYCHVVLEDEIQKNLIGYIRKNWGRPFDPTEIPF